MLHVVYAKETMIWRRTVGITKSHSIEIVKDLDTWRRIINKKSITMQIFCREGERRLPFLCITRDDCEKKEDTWYLDSGCSNHMTGNKALFRDIDKSIWFEIQLGDGTLVEASGKGMVAINTKKGTGLIHDNKIRKFYK